MEKQECTMKTQLCDLFLVLVIAFYMVCAYHTQETVHFKGEKWLQMEKKNVLLDKSQ